MFFLFTAYNDDNANFIAIVRLVLFDYYY